MKISAFGLVALGVAMMSGSAMAQCGCGGGYYAPRTYSMPSAPMYSSPVYSAPSYATSSTTVRAASKVAYVNQLTNPIDRGTHMLSYAVHLVDGRVLYTDFIPAGFNVRGTELGGSGSRRVDASVVGGVVNVVDPQTKQVIATANYQ